MKKSNLCIVVFVIFCVVSMTVKAKIENATVRIIPRLLPLAISLGTSSIEAEPGETLNLKAYVRNAYNESMRDVRIWFESEINFSIIVEPEVIEELKPNEIRSFDVKFIIPKDLKEGQYLIEMKGGSRDFSDPIEETVILKISSIKEEVYYLSLVICLSIIGLFLWRRFTYK